MNWLDLVLILIFVVAAIGGAKSGLIKSVIGLVALTVGIVLAVRFYPEFGKWLQHFIANGTWARVIAFALILVGTIIAGSIAGSFVRKLASAIGLGFFDRIGGALFGLLITAVVFGGILSLVSSAPGALGLQSSINDSLVASFLIDRALPVLGPLSPFFGDPRGWFDRPIF